MRGRESKALTKRAEKRQNLRKRGALRPQKRDVRAVGAFIKIDADLRVFDVIALRVYGIMPRRGNGIVLRLNEQHGNAGVLQRRIRMRRRCGKIKAKPAVKPQHGEIEICQGAHIGNGAAAGGSGGAIVRVYGNDGIGRIAVIGAKAGGIAAAAVPEQKQPVRLKQPLRADIGKRRGKIRRDRGIGKGAVAVAAAAAERIKIKNGEPRAA